MDRVPAAKRAAARFVQLLIVLTGIAALALLIWEPQLEGRNAHATQFEIYFKDPFLAYAYFASIAFFVALFQAYRLFGYIGEDRAASPESVRSLRTIRYCAIALIVMIGAAVAYLFIAVRGRDDIAGGVAIGLLMIGAFVVVAAATALFQRRLHDPSAR